MKKLKLYTSNIVLGLMMFFSQALACGGGWYWPDYRMSIYRVDGSSKTGLSKEELRERNICLWMKQTHRSYNDINAAVYGAQRTDYEQMLEERYLKGDTAAIKLLLLARKCETARAQISSPWYYGVIGDEPQTVLADIASESAALARTSEVFHERYALQSIRALFALRQYAECITFWNEVDNTVKEPLIRDLVLPYIAGCYYHLHQPEMAMPIFIHYGDMESVKLCAKMLDQKEEMDSDNFEDCSRNDNHGWSSYHMINILRLTAEYCPDVPDLSRCISRLIESMRGDTYEQYYYRWDDYDEARVYVLDAAKRASLSNRGLWYYAAAILSDAISEENKALDYLKEAKNCPISRKMADYIRLLEMDIFFRTATVNQSFLTKLEKEIRWIDQKLYNSFDHESISGYVWKFGYWGFNDAKPRDESDFWNMALRRVVISDICGRLDQKQDYLRMLQLTNFAENRYLHLCDGANIWERRYWNFNSVTGEYERTDALDKTNTCFDYTQYVRNSDPKEWNGIYRTELFILADSIPADILKLYINWLQQDHSGFEKLLYYGCNNDKDFWNEMLGTHYLRERRYVEAEKTLSLVSTDFLRCTNIYKDGYFTRDPFSIDPRNTRIDDDVRYKYNFAHRMSQLKNNFTHNDINIRAESMLYFSLGMKNSVEDCWALTSYYKYIGEEARVRYSLGKINYYDQIQLESEMLEKNGFELFSDRERKAKALITFSHRLEVMRDYPETQAAMFLQRHCDIWKDYVSQH